MNVIVGALNGNFSLYSKALELVGGTGFLYLLGDFIGYGGSQLFEDAISNERVKLILGKHELDVIDAYYDLGSEFLKKELKKQKWFNKFCESLNRSLESVAEALIKIPVFRYQNGVFLGSMSAVPVNYEVDTCISFEQCLLGDSAYYADQLRRACSVSELDTTDVLSLDCPCIFSGSCVQGYRMKGSSMSLDDIANLSMCENVQGMREWIRELTIPVKKGNSIFINSGLYEVQNDYCLCIKEENEKFKASYLFS